MASYGSELRAVLLKPIFKPTLNTIRDIVESGHSWRVVDYGDGVWNHLHYKNIADGIKPFVRGMERVGYKDFPLKYVSSFPYITRYYIVKKVAGV